MMRRQKLLAGFLVLASAIATPIGVAAATPTATPAAAPTPNLQIELGQSSPVELLIVGAEPTTKLRIRPVSGSRQVSNLSWQVESAITVGDRAIPAIKLPTMRASLETQVTDVATNGDITYSIVYRRVSVADSASLPPAVITQLNQQLQAIEGLTGKSVISELGEIKSAQLAFPKTMTAMQQALLDQFSQSLTNLSSPLPSQPIGIGSRWRQTTPIKLNGTVVNQTTTYELTDRQNGMATIKFNVIQATTGNLPSGTSRGELTLKSLETSGSGQMIWNLQQVMPQTATIDMTAKMLSQPPATKDQAAPLIQSDSRIQLQLQSVTP